MKYELGKIQITLIFVSGVVSGSLLGFFPTAALIVAFFTVWLGNKSNDDAQEINATEAQPTTA